MSHECVFDEIVTKFFLNTCRLCPQPGKYALQAARRCAYVAAQHPPHDTEADFIPLITGSVAEFLSLIHI